LVNLMADGTAALETATGTAMGSKIAIVVDGRIASAPIVEAPITSGDVVVASGLTEPAATSLAARLDAG
jgi:preprotein translocase subunit SecD